MLSLHGAYFKIMLIWASPLHGKPANLSAASAGEEKQKSIAGVNGCPPACAGAVTDWRRPPSACWDGVQPHVTLNRTSGFEDGRMDNLDV